MVVQVALSQLDRSTEKNALTLPFYLCLVSFADSYFIEGSDDGEIAKVRFSICQRLWDMTKSDTEVSLKLSLQCPARRLLYSSVARGRIFLFYWMIVSMTVTLVVEIAFQTLL